MKPTPIKPRIIMAHVDGSGTDDTLKSPVVTPAPVFVICSPSSNENGLACPVKVALPEALNCGPVRGPIVPNKLVIAVEVAFAELQTLPITVAPAVVLPSSNIEKLLPAVKSVSAA